MTTFLLWNVQNKQLDGHIVRLVAQHRVDVVLLVEHPKPDDALQSQLNGPVAIAFGYEDLGVPSKLINDFIRATRLKLDVVGGLVEGRVFSSEQIKQLADLPSREALIAQLMGTLQSPVSQLVGIMQAPLQQLLGVLDAYKNKLEAA